MGPVEISKCTNLVIKIYVIGYSSKGESIIVLFQDREDNSVLYTVVIDSSVYKNCNKTVEILENYGIHAIDLLCWSHPDEDHTLGMDDIITRFCNDLTKIILPYGVNGKDFDKIDYNQGDVGLVRKIIDLNEKRKRAHLTSCVTPPYFQPMAMVTFSDYPDQIDVQIHTLSPHSPLINERIGNGKKMKKNELSIALYIKVENYNFVFCSDIENPTIDNIMASCFDNPVFIKIPHHTSKTSDSLLNILKTDQSNTLGCTTVYKQHGLPDEELLERYEKVCTQVHTTGTTEKEKPIFGVVEYSFSLYDVIPHVDIKCFGPAQRVS